MLNNLAEILQGDVEHAFRHLWSGQLSDAEAEAIRNRVRRDPNYREQFHGSLAILASMEALAGKDEIQEIVQDCSRIVQDIRSQRRLALGMAAGVVLALGAVVAVFSPGSGDRALPMYFTRIGEQQTIKLDDGSVITLNTGGQLVVDYSVAARRILLERGEAYFEVADDLRRPFRVDLGMRSVSAAGTAFNIRKHPARYQVAVTDGAVTIHEVTDDVSASAPPASADGQGVVLATPGPRRVDAGWVAEFDVSRNELTAFQPESMDGYSDWRSGLLSFFHEPLSQVVQELNRYSRRKILIEDASVMDLRVVTVIRVTDIEAALRGLEHLLPIEVTRHYDRIVITATAAHEDKTKTRQDNNERKP